MAGTLFTGDMKLMGYVLTHTLSGTCVGSIVSAEISASTTTESPYLVSWSGTNSGYTASTFDVFNLCADTYVATLTDSTGATATTTIVISAFTIPTLTVSLTNADCILDTNKLGEITISESIVTVPTYTYELRKNNKLLETHQGNTADTSYVFTNIENGMYNVTVTENNIISYTQTPSQSGCTPYTFNDNGANYGWNLDTVIGNTWENYIPNALFQLDFSNGYGPATGGTRIYYATGMLQDGSIESDNPYVWFYTGTTNTRKTDKGQDWYLGVYEIDKEEGDNNKGPNTSRIVANIGKFYYNSIINKFEYLWYSYAGAISWITYDPRVDYGKPGNPRASNLTGTSGLTLQNLTGIDYTVDANDANSVQLASSVYTPGANGKLFSNSNNYQQTGMLSLCSYNNYSWQTSFNATSDDDGIYSILAAFRDDDAKYGPSGVTHSLYVGFNGATGNINIGIELGANGYGLVKDNESPFRNCQSGCTTNNPDYGLHLLASFNADLTPFSAGTNWNERGSIRMKVIRSGTTGEYFHIQFTETMGTASNATVAADDINNYNPRYDINFNLLDKTTWSGNSFSAYDSYSWLDDYDLCKFLGSRKIGYSQQSQPNASWYHITFTGSPVQQNIIAPVCDDLDGPSTTVEIIATTATTTNIINTINNVSYTSVEPGVPKVKPRVNVTLQTMPLPTVTIAGLSKPNAKLSDELGGVPVLSVYNDKEGGGTDVQFYYGGNNTDMIFGTMYPKFRIYPYIGELERIATTPIYEAIFDTLPTYYDQSSQSTILSANTFIPWSGFSTGTSWEYIVRLSYLFKDKTSYNEVWADTTPYPPSKLVNNNKDFYMALVSDPPIPALLLSNFKMPFSVPQMMIESLTVEGMPDIATDYAAYTAATYTHSIRSNYVSMALVTVNGLVVSEGDSGVTTSATVFPVLSYATLPDGDVNVMTKLATGDYKRTSDGRGVTFFPETVQNGDNLTFMYDADGGSWTQFFTIPATVSTVDTEMIYEENGYYYVNLDKQSFGAVSLSINGMVQAEGGSGYTKVDDSKIQLLSSLDTYKEGDVVALFYKTIYSVIGISMNKEPQVPVNYIKRKTLRDTIHVKLFTEHGDLVQHLTYSVAATHLGAVYRSFTLLPPAPGKYNYRVSIVSQYPLLNGESIYATSETDIISFEINRNTFYSPSGIALGNNLNPGRGGTT